MSHLVLNKVGCNVPHSRAKERRVCAFLGSTIATAANGSMLSWQHRGCTQGCASLHTARHSFRNNILSSWRSYSQMIVFKSEIPFLHTTHTPLSVANSSVSQRPDRLKHIVYSRETPKPHFLFITPELEFKWTRARVSACTEESQYSLQSLS